MKKQYGYYSCMCCHSKIREDKWKKHCETKRHIKYQEKSMFSKEIFNSNWGVKYSLLSTFIPRICSKRD